MGKNKNKKMKLDSSVEINDTEIREELEALREENDIETSELVEGVYRVINGINYRLVKPGVEVSSTLVKRYKEEIKTPDVKEDELKVLMDGPFKVLSLTSGRYKMVEGSEEVKEVRGLEFNNNDNPELLSLYSYLNLKNTFPVETKKYRLIKGEDGSYLEIEENGPDDFESMEGNYLLPYIPTKDELDYISEYRSVKDMPEEVYLESSKYMAEVLKVMLNINMCLVPLDVKDDQILGNSPSERLTFGEVLARSMSSIYKRLGGVIGKGVTIVGDPEGFFLDNHDLKSYYFKSEVNRFFKLSKEENDIMVLHPIVGKQPTDKDKLPISKLMVSYFSRNSDLGLCVIMSFLKKM